MPRYQDIQEWVKQKHGFSAQPCWISYCKALELNLPNPDLNRDGSKRKKQPPKKWKVDAIRAAMAELGIPDGKSIG